MADELTQKQKLFADEYILTGNASQSYQKIYGSSPKISESNSSRLLSYDRVKRYIEEVNRKIDNNKIADMKEVKEFWTETLRSPHVERKDRLKASEYIAKTNAAFVENHNINGNIMVNIVDNIEGEEDDCDED